MGAVKSCRSQLVAGDSVAKSETNSSLAEAMLLRSSSDYIDQVQRFSADDRRVAEHFHLHDLANTSYWEGLTDSSTPVTGRLSELVSLSSRLMFASSHLPRLLSLVKESGASPTDIRSATGSFVLELLDLRISRTDADERLESAADPDRIARVIDGANMIYRGAALLAGGTPESLRLVSITGNESRTLVFQGQQETATAVRRIIRHLSAISSSSSDSSSRTDSESGAEQTINAEFVVEQLPFLTSLNELERIGALSIEHIGDIRSSVVAGSIMLVEAGVSLSRRELPDAQAFEALPQETVTASGLVETEVEAHYLDHFAAVRERMLGETHDLDGSSVETAVGDEQHKPASAEFSGDQPDDLDDLIVDLNRLYKR